MLSSILDFRKPNRRILAVSVFAFLLAFIPPTVFELVFGQYALFSQAWIMIGVAFHEIGHLFFGFFVAGPLRAIPPLAFLAEPMRYLGGFLFNAIAGIILIALSLLLQSKLSSGTLSKRSHPMVFSFLFIAYFNLLMVPYTLTHLNHVVGKGLDFTTASFMLSITLDQFLLYLWVVAGITIALAVLVNVFFIFRNHK